MVYLRIGSKNSLAGRSSSSDYKIAIRCGHYTNDNHNYNTTTTELSPISKYLIRLNSAEQRVKKCHVHVLCRESNCKITISLMDGASFFTSG